MGILELDNTAQKTTPPTSDKLNPAAVKFSNELLVSQTLMNSYFQELALAQKNPKWEPQMMDNWFVQAGYQCTIQEVVQAQKTLAAYQLNFWNGYYVTTVEGGKAGKGPIVAIQSQGKDTSDISIGETLLIGFTFNSLVLEWSSDQPFSGANKASGQLIFRVSSVKGKITNTFVGTIGGKTVTGVMTDAENAGQTSGQTPPAISDGLQIAQYCVQMVGQLLNIGVSLLFGYVLIKQIQEMKAKGASDTDIKDKEAQSDRESDYTESAVNSGKEINKDVQEVPLGKFDDAIEIFKPNFNNPDLNKLPENPPQIDQAENDQLQDTEKEVGNEELDKINEAKPEEEEDDLSKDVLRDTEDFV